MKSYPFVSTWMDLECIVLSEISHTDRKIQIPYDFTSMWKINIKINRQNRNGLILAENKLMVARREVPWATG